MFFKDRFELGAYGAEFNNSFIVLKLLNKSEVLNYNRKLTELSQKVVSDSATYEDALDNSEELINYMYSAVEKCFVNGQIWDGEKERPMVKEDLADFPPSLLKPISLFIQGKFEKKN